MTKMRRTWLRFHKKHLQKRKLSFVFRFYKRHPGRYCWAECVSWSFDETRFNPFKIGNAEPCKTESEIDAYTHTCYCGAWMKGKCWDLLTTKEQNAFRDERRSLKTEVDDLHF